MVGSGQEFNNVKIETTKSVAFLSAVNAHWTKFWRLLLGRGQNNHLKSAFTLCLPVFPTPQYRKLRNDWDAGNSPNLYTMKSPQFLTLTSLYQKQQSSLLVKQTIRFTTPSSTVGCLPFSQPGESVPQCSLGTQCVGMTAPAGPVNLYHVRGRLASHFIVL